MTNVVINGNTYSDDGSAARDMRSGGHRSWLLPMLADAMTSVNAADADATAAAASASSAQTYAAALQATSVTSNSVGTGSKTWAVGTGKQFAVGMRVMVVQTSTPANYCYGDVTAYSSGNLTVNVTATGGAGAGITAWSVFLSGLQGAAGGTGLTGSFDIIYAAKTTTYSIVTGDKAKLIDATSGTFTMTFASPASLATGWWAFVRNSGTGVVTLAHTSGNIDGLTSYPLLPSEVRLVQCDGSTLRTIIVEPFNGLTGSQTFTWPPGYRAVGFDLVGGGGSGSNGGRAASQPAYGGGGGSGGGRWRGEIAPPAAGTSVTVSVGAGGTGVAGLTSDNTPTVGNNGSATTIVWSAVTRASAGGGNGGAASNAPASGGANGAAGAASTRSFGLLGQGAGATSYPGEWGGGHGSPRVTSGVGTGGQGSLFGGGGGGAGASQDGTNRAGGAGGAIGAYAQGTGSAGGAAAGNAGAASNSGGGGGGSNNAGTGGAGAAGNGAGCGGGGGGGVVGAFTSGAGGAGANGSAEIWGVM